MSNKKKIKSDGTFNQKNEIEELKKQIEEYKNKYLRALADYQNLEKRVFEERKEIIKTANFDLILKLLPFLDNLEKAEIFVKDQGLKLVKDQLINVLKELGLSEIDILGKEFDPNFAEAVDIVKGEKDNIVVEIVRKGYILGNKILRVAQVKVSKKIEEKNLESEINSNFKN
ncbi:MAG: nucleotide exchange factor GrpE [Patescibacteria group bacterium]|nr:nucleotide exchange factor GrpE [Patescibacteria group bacterium]